MSRRSFTRNSRNAPGIRLLDGWGSTETNFVLGATVEHQKPGLMGPVFEGFQARVVDDQDNDVADDTAGELVVRADDPFAFATGYFGTPEKTIEAWRDLWFHTGDRVVRQADGYFRFVDRLKDPSDVGAKISPPSRSSRYYSAIPLSRTQRHFPFVHRLPRMK